MSPEEWFGRWAGYIDMPSCLSALRKGRLPPPRDVFRAFKLCPQQELKVVMIGQDPYPQPDVATGLAFANRKEPLSPSLSVLKECAIDYTIAHGPVKFDITLEDWAAQGVLMLNSALTVKPMQPGSDMLLWRPFITSFLAKLSQGWKGVVYILFGSVAGALDMFIDKTGNTVIKAPHPAQCARNRTRLMPELFRETDKAVMRYRNEKIHWYRETMHE